MAVGDFVGCTNVGVDESTINRGVDRGVTAGGSSSSMRVGPCGGIVVRSCSRLDSECDFVERSPCLIAFRWPLWVARSDGGYLFSCLTAKEGKVVR